MYCEQSQRCSSKLKDTLIESNTETLLEMRKLLFVQDTNLTKLCGLDHALPAWSNLCIAYL